jgi:ketosteroid isomerase-like protein
MSQENVERIRAGYAAFNRGDFDAVVEHWGEAAEFVAPEAMPEQSSFRGRSGYRQFLASMFDVFDVFRSEPERIVEAGPNTYLVFVMERYRPKGQETAVEARLAHVITMGDGRMRRLQVFLDRRHALEAVGLSEQEVHS